MTKRILLVDDEPELLGILSEHFNGRYEIDTARSGVAALECFAGQRPDVVFLDVNMPGLNGVEVLQCSEAISAGAFGYVPKPFNLVYMDHMAAIAVAQLRRRSA